MFPCSSAGKFPLRCRSRVIPVETVLEFFVPHPRARVKLGLNRGVEVSYQPVCHSPGLHTHQNGVKQRPGLRVLDATERHKKSTLILKAPTTSLFAGAAEGQ